MTPIWKILSLSSILLLSNIALAEPESQPSAIPSAIPAALPSPTPSDGATSVQEVNFTASPDAPRPIASPHGLDFRASFSGFSKDVQVKRRALEDKWLKGERDFSDELRNSLRVAEDQFAEAITHSGDWKTAKREYQKKRAALIKELKQRAKIRREELELELIRVEREQDEAIRKLIADLETELKQFRKEKQYDKANEDFRDASSDLKSDLSKWKERMRSIKMKEATWE